METQTTEEGSKSDKIDKLSEGYQEAVEEKKPRKRRKKKTPEESVEQQELLKSLDEFSQILRPVLVPAWNGVCVSWLKSKPVTGMELELWTPAFVRCLAKWFPLLTEWKEELALIAATGMIIVPRIMEKKETGKPSGGHDIGEDRLRQNNTIERTQEQV